MNFVPCLTWVKRGKAKAQPDKIQLNQEELKKLINEAKTEHGDPLQEESEINEENDDDTIEDCNSGNERESEEVAAEEAVDIKCAEDDDDADNSDDALAKYDLDNYDDETPNPLANIAGLTVFASNQDDPYVTLKDENSDSDEEENFNILPTDNLVVVGHVDGDVSVLEVSVYNEESKDLYIHHDIILPSFPVAIEWLDFDPSDSNPCNYVAVGDMTPVISIWDLDIVNTLEPVYKLGYKLGKKKKKKLQAAEKLTSLVSGHTDAVLDLGWNKYVRHVLASGSADHSVILWDLTERKPVTKITHHKEKVQSLQWHPFEGQTILTGGCDSTVWLHDCRSAEDSHKHWTVDGEVERVLWSHFDPFYCLASTDGGYVHCFDVRVDLPVFTLKAHDEAVTGLNLSSQCSGCLITASMDKSIKVWDISNNKPRFVMEKVLNLGSLYTAKVSPDSPFVVAVGGDHRSHNFDVWDIQKNSSVRKWFSSHQLVQPCVNEQSNAEGESKPEDELASMETDAATVGVANMTLQSSNFEKKKSIKRFKSKQKKRR